MYDDPPWCEERTRCAQNDPGGTLLPCIASIFVRYILRCVPDRSCCFAISVRGLSTRSANSSYHKGLLEKGIQHRVEVETAFGFCLFPPR